MKRAYYSNSIQDYLLDAESSILGELTANHSNRTLEELQINAWRKQITILKNQLEGLEGQIYFEFAIPRMGKRVDNIVIINDIVFVIEFKVGDGGYEKHAIEQVIDYTIDLKNFHEGSHQTKLIPVLVATNAENDKELISNVLCYNSVAKSNQYNLANTLKSFIHYNETPVDIEYWENSIYKPTPTIVEAAQALYKGHNVKEITRSDSGTINLSKTADCINSVIEKSKSKNLKSICFVTGVPGAGKTLAGLNIAVERMKTDEDEHAVFLSGNGPLVDVLREALTRDEVLTAKENGEKLTKKQAAIKANAFIQNIHHFRDDNLLSDKAPIEKVVVFDEAQRAWTKHQVSSFMKRKKGVEDFDMSEPEFLIDVMNRHSDWCTIVCLIGGGQEINTGEAGLEEWINSLKTHFPDWNIHYSNSILESDNYLKSNESKSWLIKNGISESELHLSVSVRSFRSEKLSSFIHELLNIKTETAKNIYSEIKELYPIAITRSLDTAKEWLRKKGKGSERIGLISSSGARRLRPLGIDVKNEISAPNWFLNNSQDIRSSYFLEEVATEFDIQGLEIDWACVAWGGNFHMNGDDWKYQNFKGTKWQNINKEIDKEYLKNTYRVLLTRARHGMVIFIPESSDIDHTRPKEFYDNTFEYLKTIGIQVL
jgi:Schlafen group 3, DNA/RNA helicase domain